MFNSNLHKKCVRLLLWPYWPALVLGALAASWVVPLNLIVGRGGFELIQEGDIAQHIAGQRYFIADAWRWPILEYRNVNLPYGAIVAMSDSVPLLALVLKLFGVGPHAINGMYLWAWLSYVLIAIAAVYAFRAAGGRGRWAALCCATLCLSMPAFLGRINFGHFALTSHFILLLAIGAYFDSTHRSPRAVFFRYLALCLVSVLVHPYLFVMAVALAGSAVLRLAREQPKNAAAILLAGVTTILIVYLLGYFGSYQSGGEFGHFSMNLQSPFFPSGSAVFPTFGWSTPDATGGQYEGFNYLGAGVLALITVVLIRLVCSSDRLQLGRHAGLVAGCIGLLLLAVSTTAYWGTRQIWALKHYPELLAQFRASGRFFWPVAYVLTVACTAYLSRVWRRGEWAAAILSLAACLQVYDQKYNWEGNWKMFHEPHKAVIDVGLLSQMFADADRVNFFPQFGCGLNSEAAKQSLVVASRYGVPINTMDLARLRSDFSCSHGVVEPLAPGEVRMVFSGADVASVPDYKTQCLSFDSYSVCRKSAMAAPLQSAQ